MIYDVAIIGSGIVGACIARCLTEYKLQVCLIEKENDVSTGTSKANSGIIHAGYDPAPGSLMAKLNVEGCKLYPQWASQLHFDYKNCGSLVLAFSDQDIEHIKKLYNRGIQNGVSGMSILSQEELRKIEPTVSENAVGALLASTAGIISPYQATWAIAENATQNGANFLADSEVHSITPPAENNFWTIHTGKKDIQSYFVVNAAGLFADKISKMAGARNFIIKPRNGEYFLLDSNCCKLAKHTLFQTPDEHGKGVLVTPTVDGNILVGPTAGDGLSKFDTSTTSYGQSLIFEKGEKTIPDIPRRNIINSFAGIRAIAYNPGESEDNSPTPVGDFIIEQDKSAKGFINVAGICSPGLTAAPAIGLYVTQLLKNAGLKLEKNKDFISVRKGIESFKYASEERKSQLIEKDNRYGRIICRCEMITEAEIVQAINTQLGAKDLDGVKRRTRSGMGRCQGGFCSPRITEILSRELNIPMTSVTKNGGCSFILNSKIRGQ